MGARSYRDLIAWQRAIDFVAGVYRLTDRFPREEVYGLTSQLRRAAVSIASNIAEGQGRGAGQDFCHFLRISRGSLQEVETQLIIAEKLGYLSADQLAEVLLAADEVSRLLRGLQTSLSSAD